MSYYAVILAGGKATRFQGQLKHFFMIGGIPIIIHIIQTILKTNVKKIFIIINSLWKQEHFDKIKNCINNSVEFEFCLEKEALGTAKAVELIFNKNNLDYKYNVLIFLGDSPLVQSLSIESTINELKKENCDGCINSYPNLNYTKYHGRLCCDTNNKIINFIEHKAFQNNQSIKDIKLCGGNILAIKINILKELLPLIKKCKYSQEYSIFSLIDLAYKFKYNITLLAIEPWEAIGCNNFQELRLVEELYQKNKSFFSDVIQ